MTFVKKTAVVKTAAKPAVKPAATAVRKPPIKITFDAPSDMKACFIEFMFRTQADGLIGPHIKAIRVKGQWTNPNAKRYDMMTYDPLTVAALMSRLGARTFATNPLKRLPATTAFKIVIRVGLRTADGTLLSSIKSIAKQVKSTKSNKSLWKELVDKTEPSYRKIRSAARFLPGAFVNIQLPPSGRVPKKGDDDSEE